MRRLYFHCLVTVFILAGAASLARAAAKSIATVQSVKVTSTASGINIEIEASRPVAVRSQVISDPDRLVLDFPNAQPAGDLRTKLLNQGDVKGFRVARFSANPPTARVVIDLNRPQHYQIFPDGKTVIVKLMSDQQQAAAGSHIDNVSYTPPPAKPVPTMQVEYKNGRLSISAEKASLAEVLSEVQRQTGTDIPIPPGAGQEQIVANIGPLPLREALSSLLNGSRYNFILVDSEREPGKLKSVILTYRGAGGISQPAIATPEPAVTDNTPEPEPTQPEPQPEVQPQPQEGAGPGADQQEPPPQ
ncbi:MAG: AMIN domain-containing protein [Terriglobales bacterium]